jgi:putative ABC transport system permease protein
VVPNLLIARAAVRARDVALRLALGATRRQLVLEQLGEVLSLAAVAAVFGVALAYAGTRVFAVNTAHIIEAFWVDFRVDGSVLLFATLLAVVATLAAGLGPALRVSKSNVADVLKDRSHGSTSLSIGRLSRGLIGVQVALACGLLALTMVLGRAAVGLHTVPWPFDLDAVMTFEFELAEPIASDARRRAARLAEIVAAIEATPGVVAAGLTTALPAGPGAAGRLRSTRRRRMRPGNAPRSRM